MADEVSDVAQAIVDVLDGISGLKVYLWEPQTYDTLPACHVGMPTVERSAPEAPESQLGANDWRLDFPVDVYVDLSEAVASQSAAVELLESVIAAIDADYTLEAISGVQDTKVTSSTPVVLREEARAMLGYECRIEVLRLV